MDNLIKFINDPYNPETNFWLGYEYDLENNKAAALSFYLRTAEYSTNKNLIYESLLRISACLKYMGRRPKSVKNAILNAISCIPTRPEAWYFLSSYLEDIQDRKESYTAACMLELYKDNYKPTLTDINYHTFLPQFQKAVTTWWVGNCDEARFFFEDLLKNHKLTSEYTTLVHKNLAGLNGERFYKLPYTKDQYKNLKYKFTNSDTIEKNYSQVYQDMFVLSMLDGKQKGTYVEIGCADPINNNNTYLLENEFKWNGVSIDINPEEIKKFQKIRNNLALTQDALTLNYSELFSNLKFKHNIDYLQIDCEPAEITYKVLQQIPFDKYKFAVITYEHDYYADETKSYRKKSREFLTNQGYVLVAGDIAPDKNSTFEDWWVHPDLVDQETIEKFKSIKEVTDVRDYFYR